MNEIMNYTLVSEALLDRFDKRIKRFAKHFHPIGESVDIASFVDPQLVKVWANRPRRRSMLL